MRRGGAPLGDPRGGRASARTLLKWFLLNPGQKFRDIELSEVLWPGRAGNRANGLHVTQHSLRRILEPELPSRRPSRFIRSDPHGHYWFDPSDCWWTDTDEVALLSASACAARRAGDARAATASYERLLAHYEQGFLPEEVYRDAFASFRAAHERGHEDTLIQLLRLHREAGHLYEVLTCATRILDRDPYSEEAATSVAEIHLEQGSPTGAMVQLEQFVRTLREDLGVAPGPELLALRERVRRVR
ncbi:AfsR/SARP family transcriptional regulator [Streptomyces yaizuensis]|uniref:Helix-turn-helix domain-containing protein n=1 Tax=Streptomyces yaizuensis TaxID=2989713 RepID=A0ABQ5NRM5_9ACTN|nr:bacterial transcriptional activator domain-containing protein [Streptomyces sp. YSPA8]GLF93011.1 helix-turn-helix domain-containing protein [Streptomyces sp. YSPA8]